MRGRIDVRSRVGAEAKRGDVCAVSVCQLGPVLNTNPGISRVSWQLNTQRNAQIVNWHRRIVIYCQPHDYTVSSRRIQLSKFRAAHLEFSQRSEARAG